MVRFNSTVNYAFAYGQELSRTSYSIYYNTITQVQDVTCVGGSPILNSIADTSQLNIGAAIEASCVPAGSTITSKTSNTVTLNSNAIIDLTTSARFFPYGNGNGVTTFNAIDLRGVTLAGRNNMGGSSSTKLTSTYYGSNPNALAANGGNQSALIDQLNLPAIKPDITITDPGHSHNYNFPSGQTTTAGTSGNINVLNVPPSTVPVSVVATTSSTTGITAALTNNLGSAAPIGIIQPTQTINYVVKISPDLGLSVSSCLSLQDAGTACQANTGTSGHTLPFLDGINTFSGNNTFPLGIKISGTPASIIGNPSASTAISNDFTIQSLVARGAPDANNDKLLIYDNASGTLKYVTPGLIASSSTSGVSSIAGVTGAISLDSTLSITGATLSANSSILFTQSGASTSARTVQSKLTDNISLFDFNTTICDGVSNATPILQNALNNASAAYTAYLNVPRLSANCILNSSVTIPSNVQLIGPGRNSTYGFVYTPASGSAFITASGTNQFSGIKNARISTPNSIGPVIDLLDCYTCEVSNTWLTANSGVASAGIKSHATVSTKTITAITKANPAVVTSASNGFSNGDSVFIQAVSGMTQINGQYCTVTSVTTNTFACSNINSSAYSTYTSGGSATKIVGTASGHAILENNYIGFVYYGIILDGNVNSSYIAKNRIQPEANGTCVFSFSTENLAGFPNQNTIIGNTCETPNNGVTGFYLGAQSLGYNIISNRLEFTGTGTTGIAVVSGAGKSTLTGNYYEGVIALLSDPSHVIVGIDPSLPPVSYVQASATCSGVVSGVVVGTTPYNATCVRNSTGNYTVSFSTAIIGDNLPSISVVSSGSILATITSYSSAALNINTFNSSTGVVSDAQQLKIVVH